MKQREKFISFDVISINEGGFHIILSRNSLYTLLFIVGMEFLDTSIEKVEREIKEMKVRGALDIAIYASKAMKSLIESEAKDTSQLIEKLENAGSRLKKTRPTAVSLPNAIDYILFLAKKRRDMQLEDFRKALKNDIDAFISQLKDSLRKIAEIGSRLIEDGDVILTHCNSDTVVEILKRSFETGKEIKVICTETRPRYQGHITAKQLSKVGIPVTMIVDSAAFLAMEKFKVDKVMVGADTICANGDVINKVGTSQIALAAKELGIDFLVAVESIKFSPQSVMGKIVEIEERSRSEVLGRKMPEVSVYNPAFDITPAEYVTMLITELGVMPPQAAYLILKEKFGWELNFLRNEKFL